MNGIIDIINFLLIAGVLQGFTFNLVTLFVKKKFNKTVVFLNLIILFISLNNLQAWLGENDDYLSNSFLIKNLLVPWYMFIVPMFYAFTIHYLKIENKVNNFIKPTVIIFTVEMVIRLCLISYVYHGTDVNNGLIDYDPYKDYHPSIEFYNRIEDAFNLVYSIFLLINAYLIIFKRHHLLNYIISYDDIKWIRWFVRIGVVILGIWTIALILVSLNFADYKIAYLPLRFSTSVLLYWLGYQGFYKYTVVRDRISLRSSIEKDSALIVSGKQTKITSSSGDFFNEKHQSDFEKIKNHIIKDKLYLDPLLSMESVISDLGMSKSYCSKLINSYSDHNFSDFINSLRVEQAKKFLINDEFNQYTIVAIGLECGFNSKSTFYSAFKKFTSESPSTFRARF